MHLEQSEKQLLDSLLVGAINLTRTLTVVCMSGQRTLPISRLAVFRLVSVSNSALAPPRSFTLQTLRNYDAFLFSVGRFEIDVEAMVATLFFVLFVNLAINRYLILKNYS